MKFWKLISKIWFVVGIAVLVLLLYYPAFGSFYTNDDFFHFTISKADSLSDFLNFFNPAFAVSGWDFYRPLSTQTAYFLVDSLFGKNPFLAHVFLFGLFAILVTLVYLFLSELLEKKSTVLIAVFLYAVSATHFGHLYFLGNQEVVHGIFYLGSLYFWVRFLKQIGKIKWYLLSLLFFLFSLASKEFAITLPALAFLLYVYFRFKKKTKLNFRAVIKLLIPFGLICFVYAVLKLKYYGFGSGDSYIWQFSPKVLLNSLSWYGLWSLGLPEMLVDFVSFDGKINPNLWKFWSRQAIPIFCLFIILVSLLLYSLFLVFIKKNKEIQLFLLFTFGWFFVYLLPVLFLPWHKFVMYLTIPLVMISASMALLINDLKSQKILLVGVFLLTYFTLSYFNLKLTYQTNWISQGTKAAKRVYDHINNSHYDQAEPIVIVFYDQASNEDLPWKGSQQLKVILSDQNFFKVYFDDMIRAEYLAEGDIASSSAEIKIPARQFLGY